MTLLQLSLRRFTEFSAILDSKSIFMQKRNKGGEREEIREEKNRDSITEHKQTLAL